MAGSAHVARVSGVKKEDVQKVIEAIGTLAATENVSIRGFGTFKTATSAARKGRNPQTGKEIQIPAKTSLKFKASK